MPTHTSSACVLFMLPEQPVNMAGVVFRRWARALSNGNRSGISAFLLGNRAASGMTKDSLPGSYPKTPEERAAAAKKYNIRVEDYEPYPDRGEGFGDYPKLPERSQSERDPWYQWDHPDLRRNWGEPMHWDFDAYIRNRVDTSPSPVSWSSMSKQLFGFIGFMLLMFYLGEKFPSYQPVAPKQYPYNDLYLERGGDPDKQPEEVKHYEI
uniref:NADH dehydrogenase [ubiquinone] 1 beta subcomplex subunit 8, mitochondrial n=2 Tax=Monopterus albus TaxID=43700 RepID=A0A3Q3IHK9_MONAL